MGERGGDQHLFCVMVERARIHTHGHIENSAIQKVLGPDPGLGVPAGPAEVCSAAPMRLRSAALAVSDALLHSHHRPLKTLTGLMWNNIGCAIRHAPPRSAAPSINPWPRPFSSSSSSSRKIYWTPALLTGQTHQLGWIFRVCVTVLCNTKAIVHRLHGL